MTVQKTNFVSEVLANAKVSMNSTIGSVTKPGAIAELADNCVANADLISKIAENVQQTSPSQQNSVSFDIKAPSVMPSILGGGAIMALTAINPVMGAGAAAIMAVGEAISFATGHAGVKGSMPQGELTIAAADKKSFAESHPQNTYLDTAGDTYAVTTGQKQAPAAQAQPASTLDRRLAMATQEVAGDYSQEQMAGDIKSMLGEQQKNYAWAQNKLEMLGSKDPNASPTLDIAAMAMKPLENKKAMNFAIPALG